MLFGPSQKGFNPWSTLWQGHSSSHGEKSVWKETRASLQELAWICSHEPIHLNVLSPTQLGPQRGAVLYVAGLNPCEIPWARTAQPSHSPITESEIPGDSKWLLFEASFFEEKKNQICSEHVQAFVLVITFQTIRYNNSVCSIWIMLAVMLGMIWSEWEDVSKLHTNAVLYYGYNTHISGFWYFQRIQEPMPWEHWGMTESFKSDVLGDPPCPVL